MKKFLMSILLTFTILSINLPTNASLLEKSDYIKIQKIGNKLIQSNNIDHRYTFNFAQIGHQGANSILLDTSYANDLNLHNNRVITIYYADYLRLSSDDEIASLIAHELAQGEHSYTGILKGQLMFTKNGYFPFNHIAKKNELKFDEIAINYLIQAGYNPKAFVSALNKTGAEWRGTFWGRHNKTQKRIDNINKCINNK